MTTLNEIQTAVDAKEYKILKIEETTKGTAIVTITKGLQKEMKLSSALTLADWNGLRVTRQPRKF